MRGRRRRKEQAGAGRRAPPGRGAEFLHPFADGAGMHGAQVQDRDVEALRDPDAHARAADRLAVPGPAHDRVHRGGEIRAEEDADVPGVQAAGAVGASVPCGVRARGVIQAAAANLSGRHVTIRAGVPPISGPGKVEGACGRDARKAGLPRGDTPATTDPDTCSKSPIRRQPDNQGEAQDGDVPPILSSGGVLRCSTERNLERRTGP